MNGISRAWAVAVRVFRQVLRDRRTVALMLVVPTAVLSLVAYLLEGPSSPPTVAVVAPTERLASWFAGNVLEPVADGTWVVVDGGTASPEELIRGGRASAVLVVPRDVLIAPLQGRVPPFEIVVEGADYQATGRLLGDLRRLLPELVAHTAGLVAGPLGPGVGSSGLGLSSLGSPRFSVRYVYGGESMRLADYLAPGLLGYLTFFFVFLLTATSFLRERQRGTLVRMITSPLQPWEIMAGYMVGFSVFVVAQVAIVMAFVVWVLEVVHRGNLGWVVVIELLTAFGAASLGIFLSAFARNELQVIQFVPVVIIPQAVLSGLVVSVDLLPPALKPLAYAVPLTYTNRALTDVMIRGMGPGEFWHQLVVLAAFAALFAVLGSRSVKRA